ncbi:sensor histidine kinase [Aliikangiella coralliicola]|uniref:histidine kinase n=1 Tax=Aliikangiella coralliicola TaxID=2592383 RepID=A0A545UCQ9_9GAMM|nr:HAMP domain-containing sensor histidine kinase [Aliikangiella coralliicola]TQV87247.1 HAMP domain-containing histidine kinase [Aliikangiella coralliicola]
MTFRKNITSAFISFSILLSCLYGLLVWGAAYMTEDSLYEHILVKQKDKFMERYNQDKMFQPPQFGIVTGKILSIPLTINSKVILNQVVELDDKHHLQIVLDEKRWLVFSMEESDGPVDYAEPYLIGLILLIGSFVIFCGIGVGTVVARQLSEPLEDLVRQVKQSDPSKYQKITSHKNDDVRALANAFNSTMLRVQKFIRRESDFTQSVSHELRSPLTVIKVNLALMQQHLSDAELYQRMILRMTRATRNMESLTETFLLLAREENFSQTSTSFKPSGVFKQVIRAENERRAETLHEEEADGCHQGARRKLQLDWRFSDENAMTLNSNESLFEIITRNIVDNAFKYAKLKVSVIFRPNHLIVYNPISGSTETEIGAGVGLKIIQRICDALGWELKLSSTNKYFILRINFGHVKLI